MSKRDFALEQIALQEKIQREAGVNIVCCCNCDTILLHEIHPIKEGIDEKPIECCGCNEKVYPNDCTDLWYSNCENNAEFND